jgi:hypothetical protein
MRLIIAMTVIGLRVFVIAVCLILPSTMCQADESERTPSRIIDAIDGAGLQRALDEHATTPCTLRVRHAGELTCLVQESKVGEEISRHALLIPENIVLDLNGGTLLLDLRSNSHGVRLSNHSGIRNGTIRIVRSENKGSQGIWHSAISIGAPYDDGGTPAKPGYFSKIEHWSIEDMTIDQPFAASAIQIMSEGCFGVIRRVRILDSKEALLGIGMDWGSVGKMTTADETIPLMRKLWEKHEIYSTHPHDILIEDITIGNLTRNVDANDAGVRCSACYNIRIRNVNVASAAAGVAIFGGDCGFEFAPKELRPLAHTGYEIDGLSIDKAFRIGMVLNGLSDNVYRSSLSHGYQMQLDPAQPGLNGVVIRNTQLAGDGSPKSLGMFITAVSKVQLQNVAIKDFDTGVRMKNWINGLQFKGCDLSHNKEAQSTSSSAATPQGVVFE